MNFPDSYCEVISRIAKEKCEEANIHSPPFPKKVKTLHGLTLISCVFDHPRLIRFSSVTRLLCIRTNRVWKEASAGFSLARTSPARKTPRLR